jgi:hypothetical protein
MRKIISLIFPILIAGLLLFPVSCKKAEEPEPAEETTLSPGPAEPGFNPDEPAPVPEGTPEY